MLFGNKSKEIDELKELLIKNNEETTEKLESILDSISDKNTVNELNIENENLTKANKRLISENDELLARKKELMKSNTQLMNRNEGLKEELTESQKIIETFQKTKTSNRINSEKAKQLKEDINQLNQEVNQLEVDNTTLKNENINLADEITEKETKIMELDDKLIQINEQYNNTKKDLESKLTQKEKVISNLHKQINDLKEKVSPDLFVISPSYQDIYYLHHIGPYGLVYTGVKGQRLSLNIFQIISLSNLDAPNLTNKQLKEWCERKGLSWGSNNAVIKRVMYNLRKGTFAEYIPKWDINNCKFSVDDGVLCLNGRSLGLTPMEAKQLLEQIVNSTGGYGKAISNIKSRYDHAWSKSIIDCIWFNRHNNSLSKCLKNDTPVLVIENNPQKRREKGLY